MKILNKETFNVYDWADNENSERRLKDNSTLEKYDGETEEAYNGLIYAKGYAPQQSEEEKKHDVRLVRDRYLSDSDKHILPDFPEDEEERADWIEYRKYLRDYTKQDYWWENDPKTFKEWIVKR